MDNSSADNQIELEALAHEVCRSHSARPERELYRICPSKLSKRELEDLYFALLENNLELKRTVNSQNDKLKMLSTKVQRLSANKTPGSKDKDCCLGKSLISEQKDSITELKKCNERMAERIRILNMRLCSAKQFLKKQPPEQKSISKNQLKNNTNFQNFKKVCDRSRPHQAAIEYKISKSVETSPDNPLVPGSPKKVTHHECDENRCRTAIAELQHKINELQEALHITQYNYTSKLQDLENEIRSVKDDNVRTRADSVALEERGDELVNRLRAAEAKGGDLETQLAIEKRKVKELETRLKLAENDKNRAKSLDQFTIINDADESPEPSYKFQSGQSISESKIEPEVVGSAISYFVPHKQESQVSVKSVKVVKRVEPEVELLAPVPSQKSSRRESQVSNEPKPRESKTGSELPKNEHEEGSPMPSSKGQRKESIAKTQEPKRGESKIDPHQIDHKPELKKEPSTTPSKGQRKESIEEHKEPKHLESKTKPELRKPDPKETLPIPSPKGKRKESITETNASKSQEYKIKPELQKKEHEEGTKIPSSTGKRKESIAETKASKSHEHKIKPELQKNELEEGTKLPSSTGKRKDSITETKASKSQEFKIEPELQKNELEEGTKIPSTGKRKDSIAETKQEATTPTKSSHEVKFSKSDDSGYTDPNKSYDGEPEKDEEMLKINHELLKKIADLKSQLDLLMIAAAGVKKGEPAPAQLREPFAADTKMMENGIVPTKSLSMHSTTVPNKIVPKQQVQAKTEDIIKSTPSSVKPEVVQNAGQIPKQNENNLRVPYEDKEQKLFSFNDHADNYFNSDNLSSPPLEKTKPISDKKNPNLYEDRMEQPIPYEILVPRSSLYPEMIQKVPQNIQEVKSQSKEEMIARSSSYKNNLPTANQSITPEPPIQKKMLSSYETIAQRPRSSEENIPMISTEVATKQLNTFEEKMPMSSPYEDKSKYHPYQERLSTPSSVKPQFAPYPFEYEAMPRDIRLPSYDPNENKSRKLSLTEDIRNSSFNESAIHKSPLYEDKTLIPDKRKELKEYVDNKRQSLFYKDEVPKEDQKEELIAHNEKVAAPNVNGKSDPLYYEEPKLPYEDKIYPDEQSITDAGTKSRHEYFTPTQGIHEGKRSPSLYAERIQKFSVDENAPTTSSPYEEKMQKLNNEKQQMSSLPEDDKSKRFESYLHMAERDSKDDGPTFAKFQDRPEDDENNIPKEKRRSSLLSTGKADDHNGSQIPGPIPSTTKPAPIERKKHRLSFEKQRKRSLEEKTVTIQEDHKEPSGHSIYFDKSSIYSKNDSAAFPGTFDDDNKHRRDLRKEWRPTGSIDSSQVNTGYNSKTPQVESYPDMVGQGVAVPPSAMRENGTQMDPIVWCVAGARVCTCIPGPPVRTPLLTCIGTNYPAPPHLRYCACCNEKNTQAPGPAPRRDSATFTQSDNQPQTYTVTAPKDAYTQPRRESLDQTQNGTQETQPPNAYKRDTFVHTAYHQDMFPQVGQDAQAPRYSRSTSPDNTEKEISSLPDLPQEKEIKSTQGYLSPGEKATMTFTDNETNTECGSLSEGELPGNKKATKSYGEKSVETTQRPVESTTQRMEDVLKSISEELSRCHRLLASQKRQERIPSEWTKPAEDDGVQLRASQGARRLTGAHHVCVFTLHIGTLVLSDEAILQSRDKNLVLTWRFFDQSVTMTRMRAGRVFVFDFSTEYDVVFSEEFLKYMKFEKMPLLVCEISKQDFPFATCSLPLRDALLHVNRRADMSLALTSATDNDTESTSVELGVLDLWCVLRCDAVITQHITKSMARSSTCNMSARTSYMPPFGVDEDLSNERLSEDLDLKIKKESRDQDAISKNIPINQTKPFFSGYPPPEETSTRGEYAPPNIPINQTKPFFSGYPPPEETSTRGEFAPPNIPINQTKPFFSGYPPPEETSTRGEFAPPNEVLNTGTLKLNTKRRSYIGHPHLNFDRKETVSFDASSNWASSKFAQLPDSTGLIANAVPSNIRSTEEMKAALERNTLKNESRKMSDERSSLSRKNQLSKLKFTKKLSEDAIGSLQDLISNNRPAAGRRHSPPKYELPPIDKGEDQLVKKYNDITKLMVAKMDAAKKSVKYSDDDEQPQRGAEEDDPSPQSIEITVLWLALNEECDAMVNPNIKRLYVAYKFLGRTGAELETPVSLPKPKHYVDKCFFNFKKTFNLHDADLPALGHMARVRAGSRVSTDPRDCLVFTVVSEPPEDPLGLSSCEDVGYAYVYLGDILAYSSGSGAYTEVVAVHAARGSAVCGVLAVKIDGLHVLRRALTLSHSAKDLERPVMAY